MEDKFDHYIFGFFIGALVSLVVYDIIQSNHPTAMDVYGGKTTLKYEVIDDVKVDSIVIFKPEFK